VVCPHATQQSIIPKSEGRKGGGTNLFFPDGQVLWTGRGSKKELLGVETKEGATT